MSTSATSTSESSITLESSSTVSVNYDEENETMSLDAWKTYSSNELQIGYWINSKPLYRKVLTFTNAAVGSKGYTHGISNLDQVVSVSGYYKDAAYGTQPIPLVVPDACAAYSIGIGNISSTSLTIIIGTSRSATNTVVLILEYTKTTD